MLQLQNLSQATGVASTYKTPVTELTGLFQTNAHREPARGNTF